MSILELFVEFFEKILSFKILGYTLYSYLIGFLAAIFVFKLIMIFGNTESKRKKKGDD